MIGDGTSEVLAGRARVFAIIVLAVLGLLVIRLAQLQLLDNQVYSGASRDNAVRELRVLPARGTVYDRHGVLLVDNEPAYSILLTPRYFDATKSGLLANLLEIDVQEVDAALREARKWNAFRPTAAFHGINFDIIARVLEHRSDLPGVTYEATQKRRYLAPFRAAHAMGYVREITRSDLERRRESGYRSGDLVGQAGIEETYEPVLRGRLGSAFKLVNVHGQEVEPFRSGSEDTAPVGGRDIYLSIDAGLQSVAESLFVNKRGAAVALDPYTGDVLSLLSMPDYDPVVFSRSVSQATWTYLSASPEKPLFNRATSSLLPPGSTWKPLIALIALQEGVITPDSRYRCPGYHPLGRGRIFRCMHIHGAINVTTAIEESCNTFFFEMMRRVDVNTFSRYAHEFGFGERHPFDLADQSTGIIPDSAYFDRTYPSGWTVGYAMNLGVGQGDMGVTPMQLARYVASIGNGGMLPTPHLVSALVDPETGDRTAPEVTPPHPLPISASNLRVVQEGMVRVMESGTGKWIQIPGIPSGGKTGTAQNSRGKDDSVFVLFAPAQHPQIAIAVLVENAGYGATAAGPIATLMAEKYLTGRISKARRPLFELVRSRASDPLPN